jgi:hypothetical protein
MIVVADTSPINYLVLIKEQPGSGGSPIPVTTTRRPLPIGSLLPGLSSEATTRSHRTGGNARIRFATDNAFSGGKSRLAILPHVNGIQFFDKALLLHSQT